MTGERRGGGRRGQGIEVSTLYICTFDTDCGRWAGQGVTLAARDIPLAAAIGAVGRGSVFFVAVQVPLYRLRRRWRYILVGWLLFKMMSF